MLRYAAQSTELLADLETPVSAYLKLCADKENSFLLESGELQRQVGRYSVVGWEALAELVLYPDGCKLRLGSDQSHHPVEEFYPLLQKLNDEIEVTAGPELPCVGSLVGYIGWDCVRLIEEIPADWEETRPTARLFLPGRLAIFDHLSRRLTMVALGGDEAQCRAKLGEMQAALQSPLPQVPEGGEVSLTPPAKEPFLAAVKRAKEHILDGDIFQVVLSGKFTGSTDVDPLSAYRQLRVKSPSPYMFFLNFGAQKLAGASPETMVKLEGGQVMVRPIAGTRGRSSDPVEDQRLEAEMMACEKERAEHVMLVDLARNDVGRVADYGTVSVEPYMSVERYSHVMHITSQVQGELHADKGAVDAFTAAFPAGTLSGAPKVRAMQIIDELEPAARGVYGGAIGSFGPGRRMDTCIAIRFLEFMGEELTIQVGAGIVADSSPEMEYQEINHKAAQSLAALEAAAKGVVS